MSLKLHNVRVYMSAIIAALIISHNAFSESAIVLQRQDSVKGERLIEYIRGLLDAKELVGFPNVPSVENATSAPYLLGFISMSLAERVGTARNVQKLDGSIAIGVGIEEVRTGVLVQPSLTITSVKRLGASGYAGLKFSRKIYSGEPSVYASASFDRIGGWGGAKVLDSTQTYSLTGFSSFSTDTVKYPVMWTLGYGTNVKKLGTKAGFQAGVGVGIYENTAFGLSTNGDLLNAGFSITLPEIEDINLSIGFSDVLDNDNARSAYIAVNYTFQLFGNNRNKK